MSEHIYPPTQSQYDKLAEENKQLRELLKQFYHNLLVSCPNRMERELLKEACAALEGKCQSSGDCAQ